MFSFLKFCFCLIVMGYWVQIGEWKCEKGEGFWLFSECTLIWCQQKKNKKKIKLVWSIWLRQNVLLFLTMCISHHMMSYYHHRRKTCCWVPSLYYRLHSTDCLSVNSNVRHFLGCNLQLRWRGCLNYIVHCIHINEGMVKNRNASLVQAYSTRAVWRKTGTSRPYVSLAWLL